nr:TetR/AcrR family transcriptional regulator [uncultured Flavonifractor sp.]
MSPRRALNRQRTIQDIEAAFLTLYQRNGIDGVSISGICQACGIARSTFYLYFEDKFAVLQGVEDRLLSALWEICRNLPDVLDRHGGGTEPALRTIAHIRENLDWYRALLSNRGDPMFVYRWKKDIVKSLHRKLEQRNVNALDAEIQGVVFSSALIGLYTHVTMECPDIPDQTLCRYMDDLLARSLEPLLAP